VARPGRRQQLLAEGGEAGADGLAGDLVEEAPACQVNRAEDGAAPVAAGGHDPLAGAVGDPGGAHPGQQVEVGLVLGQQDRAVGQVAELLVEVGEDLVAVGIASCDQAGSPPPGDLAHTSAQGPHGHGGVAQLPVEPADGPRVWLGKQPADALAKPWLPSLGRPGRGRSHSPAAPWVL
jgi:hypothetical protein